MNKKLIISAVLATAFAAAIPASAQDHGYRNDNNWQQRTNERDANSQQRRDEIQQRWDEQRRYEQRRDYRDNRDYRGSQGNWGRTADYHAGYDGAGPYHDLRRGQRLPTRYNSHQYVVNDWRGHHLKSPPRGYHWVQTGSDYVLVGIATGLIADMLINN